ncbi:MAG: GGDEF domain-containing protein, partial [Anaerotignaceae bacterium]
FMTSWLIFSNGYFLFNSLFFSSPKTEVLIKYNIIAVSLTMLFALYTVLLFTIKIGKLLNYKEKSDFLENAVEDEKQFKNTVIEQAIVGLEVNLTENKVVSSFGKAFDNSENTTGRYSDLVFTSLPYRVHKDDLEMVLHFMSITTLLDKYCKGEVDLSLEYRAMLHGSTDYIWIKAFFTLYKSSKTDSVMVFTYAKDIDAEKQLALEMKSRSERDTLTGLYNHGMTKQLVNEFIHEETQIPCKGALLIVDIDNFKLINDNFGHGFGDEVLRDISKKLTSVFRCDNNINSVRREDDIVGRIGGDEFMVFVKTSDVKGLTARTSRICEILKKTYTTADGKDITISASVGIAVVKDKDDDFKSLYAKADVALYNSKRKGKNCFSFYNGESFQGYKAER